MADTLNEGIIVDEDRELRGAAPWHFWAIAAVGLLWNSFGALDYTMTQLRNPGWIGQIDPEMLAKIDAAPNWATAMWALGVWGSFAGAVLLLMRSRYAPWAFAVSFLGAVISFSWQYSVGLVSTPILPLVILAVVAFYWWYATAMRREGVLR